MLATRSDIPARRYPQIAEEVREICERYGLDYNTGPLTRQLASVAKKICRLALPNSVSRLPSPPSLSRLPFGRRSQDASPVAPAERAA